MDSTQPPAVLRAVAIEGENLGEHVLEALSDVLWRERELLETLLFRMHAQLQFLTVRHLRWSARADDDVREALRSVRECEVLRTMESDTVLTSLGLSGDSTLPRLAASVAEPWSTILHDHRNALATLTAEIESSADAIREVVSPPSGAAITSEDL